MRKTRITTLATVVAAATPGRRRAPSPALRAQRRRAVGPMKIGLVTDVGTLNDRNFNEYTFEGAQDGAAAIGAAEPGAFVPKDASDDIVKNIQAFVDQGYDIIVTIGFASAPTRRIRAKANPDIWFIGYRPVTHLRRRQGD